MFGTLATAFACQGRQILDLCATHINGRWIIAGLSWRVLFPTSTMSAIFLLMDYQSKQPNQRRIHSRLGRRFHLYHLPAKSSGKTCHKRRGHTDEGRHSPAINTNTTTSKPSVPYKPFLRATDIFWSSTRSYQSREIDDQDIEREHRTTLPFFDSIPTFKAIKLAKADRYACAK